MPVVGFGTAGLGTPRATRWRPRSRWGTARSIPRRPGSGTARTSSGRRSRRAACDADVLDVEAPSARLGFDATVARFGFLADLRTEYLDLFLLHYPRCFAHLCDGHEPEGTWRQLARAGGVAGEGKVRAIGVSNFDLRDLKELEVFASPPAVVQRNSGVFSATSARIFCTARVAVRGVAPWGVSG